MNILCREMRRSLKELDLGLSGELQMSERMEDLFNSLYLGRVPASWTKLAYPSQRSLSSWMDNLIARAGQLQAWVEEPVSIPLVVQITYMFNPQSFLTAIMQKTAQKQKLELDKLVIQVRTMDIQMHTHCAVRLQLRSRPDSRSSVGVTDIASAGGRCPAGGVLADGLTERRVHIHAHNLSILAHLLYFSIVCLCRSVYNFF